MPLLTIVIQDMSLPVDSKVIVEALGALRFHCHVNPTKAHHLTPLIETFEQALAQLQPDSE